MSNKKSNESKNNVSRRKFLQGGAILSAAVGLSSLTGGKATEQVVEAFGKKELEAFPHDIATDFKRYDVNRTTFLRRDPGMRDQLVGLPGMNNVIDDSRPGYTNLDRAFNAGASAIVSDFSVGSKIGRPNTAIYTWEKTPKSSEFKYKFASKEDASKSIKKAAKFYGASLVGITAYDEKWVYDPIFTIKDEEGNLKDIRDTDFPFKPKSVVVLAIEMDYEVTTANPSSLGIAATRLGYSQMCEVNYKVSTFIRELGYNAFGSGNDTAMSVPYAIAAGLGEQGRQGLLLTYEYGPRVRLCKVFTDMDLAYDKPIEFGANKFCQVCKKCAYSCPSESISLQDEMTWKAESYSISNHEATLKYYVNVETCYVYWATCGNGCGVCITACPFNKPDFWHHRITTALTATPLKPFLNEMDDLFGYGNVFDEQVCIDFWGLDTYTK